jgi:hypothetical protein
MCLSHLWVKHLLWPYPFLWSFGVLISHMYSHWIYKAQKENRYWIIHSGMYQSSGSLTLAFLLVSHRFICGWLRVQCMVDVVALEQVFSLEFILFSPYFIIAEYLTCYFKSPWHLAGYGVKLFPVCTKKKRYTEIAVQFSDTINVVPVECLVSYVKMAFFLHWTISGLCLYCWSTRYGKRIVLWYLRLAWKQAGNPMVLSASPGILCRVQQLVYM